MTEVANAGHGHGHPVVSDEDTRRQNQFAKKYLNILELNNARFKKVYKLNEVYYLFVPFCQGHQVDDLFKAGT